MSVPQEILRSRTTRGQMRTSKMPRSDVIARHDRGSMRKSNAGRKLRSSGNLPDNVQHFLAVAQASGQFFNIDTGDWRGRFEAG